MLTLLPFYVAINPPLCRYVTKRVNQMNVKTHKFSVMSSRDKAGQSDESLNPIAQTVRLSELSLVLNRISTARARTVPTDRPVAAEFRPCVGLRDLDSNVTPITSQECKCSSIEGVSGFATANHDHVSGLAPALRRKIPPDICRGW